MNRKSTLQAIAAVVMLALAVYFFLPHFQDRGGRGELAFFYDLSEQKLFTAPLSSVPPIRGLNDEQFDAVRAVVIAPPGREKVKSEWTIAYLEMYSPELKRQFEARRNAPPGEAPPMRFSRARAQGHTLVRRLADPDWHPINSPEGERIISEWQASGPDGRTPVVCVP